MEEIKGVLNMEKAIKIVSSMVKELKGPFNLEKAARILSILSVLFIVVGWFWSEPRRAYALTDEVRQIYKASHIVGVICLTLFGIALLLLRKKHITNQRIIAAFALSIVAVTMLAAWSIVAALLPKGDIGIRPVTGRFKLLSKLEGRDIQLYAISDESPPPALVLFRHDRPFLLNWKCLSNGPPSQMMLNRNGNENEELYIPLFSGIGIQDLYVLRFENIEKASGYDNGRYDKEIIMSDYCLKGEDYMNWLNEPIILKEPLQEKKNVILFAEKEHSIFLRGTNDIGDSLLTVSYGTTVEFILHKKRREISVRLNVYAEYAGDDTGIYIGHVDANVHFNDGVFTLSDLEFVTVT